MVERLLGQLGATDDGSVVLDVPDDQFSTRGVPGALSFSADSAGIRLDSVELTSDARRLRVTCDLRMSLVESDMRAVELEGRDLPEALETTARHAMATRSGLDGPWSPWCSMVIDGSLRSRTAPGRGHRRA
jgi:hypothetical protein